MNAETQIMKSPHLTKLTFALAAAAAVFGGISSVRGDSPYATAVEALNPLVYMKLNEPAKVVPTYVATNLGSAGELANGIYLGDDTIFTEPFYPGAIVSESNTDAA